MQNTPQLTTASRDALAWANRNARLTGRRPVVLTGEVEGPFEPGGCRFAVASDGSRFTVAD